MATGILLDLVLYLPPNLESRSTRWVPGLATPPRRTDGFHHNLLGILFIPAAGRIHSPVGLLLIHIRKNTGWYPRWVGGMCHCQHDTPNLVSRITLRHACSGRSRNTCPRGMDGMHVVSEPRRDPKPTVPHLTFILQHHNQSSGREESQPKQTTIHTITKPEEEHTQAVEKSPFLTTKSNKGKSRRVDVHRESESRKPEVGTKCRLLANRKHDTKSQKKELSSPRGGSSKRSSNGNQATSSPTQTPRQRHGVKTGPPINPSANRSGGAGSRLSNIPFPPSPTLTPIQPHLSLPSPHHPSTH